MIDHITQRDKLFHIPLPFFTLLIYNHVTLLIFLAKQQSIPLLTTFSKTYTKTDNNHIEFIDNDKICVFKLVGHATLVEK